MAQWIKVWENREDGDVMQVSLQDDGKVYGAGNRFDFERDSVEEAEKQLKAWGYEHVGWE